MKSNLCRFERQFSIFCVPIRRTTALWRCRQAAVNRGDGECMQVPCTLLFKERQTGPAEPLWKWGGGGGCLTSDSKWGGSWKHLVLSKSLKFPKKWGGGGLKPPLPLPLRGPCKDLLTFWRKILAAKLDGMGTKCNRPWTGLTGRILAIGCYK